ncbi:MAG: hypothetical protein RRX95_02760 [Oscillospiraceae bacterium]
MAKMPKPSLFGINLPYQKLNLPLTAKSLFRINLPIAKNYAYQELQSLCLG